MRRLHLLTHIALGGAATLLALLGPLSAPVNATETALEFSYDGSNFRQSLPHQLFTSGQPVLIPGGQPVLDTFYVRNRSNDSAVLTVHSEPLAVDGTSTKRDLRALSVNITMDGTSDLPELEAPPGRTTTGITTLGAGETTTVEIALSLRWISDRTGNGDTGEGMVIDPGLTVELRLLPDSEPIYDHQPPVQNVPPSPEPVIGGAAPGESGSSNEQFSDELAEDPSSWLPYTGVRGLLVISIVGGIALSLGMFLVYLRRKSSRR